MSTRFLVDNQLPDPWLIAVDLNALSREIHPVALYIGLAILVFELQQSDVEVTEKNILSFVDQDIQKHQTTALNGYLTIARAIISPRPTRKSLGWFARVFTQPTKWEQPPPRWRWTSVTQIAFKDDALVIHGRCCNYR